MSAKKSIQLNCIWLSFAIFYCIESAVKVSPSVMYASLMTAFHINNSCMGLYSSIFFLMYSILQIPAGWMLERFSLHNIMLSSLIIFLTGNIITVNSHSFTTLLCGRVILGCGSAFVFLSILKFNTIYINRKNMSLSIGLTNCFGVIGCILASNPLAIWLQHNSWQSFFVLIIQVIVFITIILLCINIFTPLKHKQEDKMTPVSAIKNVLRNKKTFYISLYAGLHITPIIAFCEMWSPFFLMETLNIPAPSAAKITSGTYIGIILGGPFWGFLEKIEVINSSSIKKITSVTLIVFASITTISPNNIYSMYTLYLLLGMSCSSILLCYKKIRIIHEKNHIMLHLALLNTYISIPSIAIQPIIGMLLPIHNVTWYQFCIAFTPITIALAIGIAIAKHAENF